MGDFTSKYRVTYSDGTQRTETRVDALKAGGNLFLYALIFIAIIALIPALILLPLMLYVTKPYRLLKGVNPDYQSTLLKEYGYDKLAEFQKSVKTKMWFIMTILIAVICFVDYLSFTSGAKMFTTSETIFEVQLKYSVFLFLFYLIVPFIVNKDRVLSKKLEGIDKFNFIEKSHKNFKRIISIMFLPLIVFIVFVVSISYYLESLENKFYEKTYEMENYVYEIINNKNTNIVVDGINEPIIELNSLDRFLLNLPNVINYTHGNVLSMNELQIKNADYAGTVNTMFFHLLTTKCFELNDWYKYKKRMKMDISDEQQCSVTKMVNIYKNKLGGDINAVDTYGYPLVVTSPVSEAIYQLIKLGANWEDVKRDIGNNEEYSRYKGFDKKYNEKYTKLINKW